MDYKKKLKQLKKANADIDLAQKKAAFALFKSQNKRLFREYRRNVIKFYGCLIDLSKEFKGIATAAEQNAFNPINHEQTK